MAPADEVEDLASSSTAAPRAAKRATVSDASPSTLPTISTAHHTAAKLPQAATLTRSTLSRSRSEDPTAMLQFTRSGGVARVTAPRAVAAAYREASQTYDPPPGGLEPSSSAGQQSAIQRALLGKLPASGVKLSELAELEAKHTAWRKQLSLLAQAQRPDSARRHLKGRSAKAVHRLAMELCTRYSSVGMSVMEASPALSLEM